MSKKVDQILDILESLPLADTARKMAKRNVSLSSEQRRRLGLIVSQLNAINHEGGGSDMILMDTDVKKATADSAGALAAGAPAVLASASSGLPPPPPLPGVSRVFERYSPRSSPFVAIGAFGGEEFGHADINAEMPHLAENHILHEAISNGNHDDVAVLLLYGADPHLTNRYGETAFELAEVIGDPITKSHLARFHKQLGERQEDLDEFRRASRGRPRGKGLQRRANPFVEHPAGRKKEWKKKDVKSPKWKDRETDDEKSEDAEGAFGEKEESEDAEGAFGEKEESEEEKEEEKEEKEENAEDFLLKGARNAGGRVQDLFSAIRGGRLDKVKTLAVGDEIHARDRLKRTPLMIALEHGTDETVEHLIDIGSDMNAVDARGNTVKDYMRSRAERN